jgi:hypothetical protein
MAHRLTIKSILFFFVCVGITAGKVLGSMPVQANAEIESKDNISARVNIQDPLILDGWNYLDSLEEPVTLWDGNTLTGKALAQFLRAEQVPVIWGSDEVCGGSSCSRQYCAPDGACSYEDGQPGIDPIYINTGARDQKVGQTARVAKELAHEAFHRMQPFGLSKITQFEEYWAFYIENQIVKTSWPDFKGYDPMDVNSLQHWFSMHMLAGYLNLDPYPEGFGLNPERSVALKQPANDRGPDRALVEGE